jgi:beta-N-acetylhexosaminidase
LRQEKEEMDHLEEQEKREIRRRRRIRNQIVAYVTLLLSISIMAVLLIWGFSLLKPQQSQDADINKEEVLESIFASEETLPQPEPTQASEPTEVLQEPSPEEQLDQIIEEAIAVMPIEDKVAGLFFVTPESITGVSTVIRAGEGTKEALNK